MLAINWFEVILPSFYFEVYVEPRMKVSNKRPKELGYRSLVKGEKHFHITASDMANIPTEKINIVEYPSIASYAIEHGFASKLVESGFEVRFKHVGALGVRPSSIATEFRNVYSSLSGLAFRCFFGFGDGQQLRWGLILRYITSHRFMLNLQESSMRKLALGHRIVRFNDDQSTTEALNMPRSGYLTRLNNETRGTLTNDEGISFEINLANWTLPCNPENLSAYVRLVMGSDKVSRVAVQLQKEAFALNANGRINNNYARDHLITVQSLLEEFQLTTFKLPLIGQPLVHMSNSPLSVSD